MDYDIRPFQPDHLNGVVECLSPLWGNNFQENLSTFKWKHIENPYVEEPLGTVAMYRGQVIGFRGFFATRWQVPAKQYLFTLLSPCDTCVNPRVQQRGLSVTMGRFAMKEYQERYQVFLNTSGSPLSLPGYLRMGFVPLAAKTSLNRRNWLRLLWRRKSWSKEQQSDFYRRNLEYGIFGAVSVEREVRPDAMAKIIAQENAHSNRISLVQDSTFFRWRFNNRSKRYVFYFFKDGDSLRAYIVIDVARSSAMGIVVDYAEEPGIDGLEPILLHIMNKDHFAGLSIPDQALSPNALHRLYQLKFRSDPVLLNRWRGKVDIPFLVRPVREECRDTDWLLEGLDIRHPEHWQIKGVSNDGLL